MRTYEVGFIIEQVLGHITHTRNLQQNVPDDPQIHAHWGPVAYEMPGVAGRIPLYKSNWTLRGGVRARQAVAAIARKTALDALFFHTQVPATLSLDWLRRIPSIISLDATPRQYNALAGYNTQTSSLKSVELVKWRLARASFAAARHLVTWSEWAKDGLIKEYDVPAEKITVIPPGVNTTDWTRPAGMLRNDGPVKILFVGGDLERKGGFLMIAAFRELRALGAELHIATRDPVPDEPGIIVHHGLQPNTPELKRLYHESDIFCLPTLGDCLPMVLSEASAAGLPSVTTQLAAIPEVVRDGETGLLVPVGDGAALKDALKQLIEDAELRRRLGAAAVSYVAEHYDARRNALDLMALIKAEVDAAQTQARAA